MNILTKDRIFEQQGCVWESPDFFRVSHRAFVDEDILQRERTQIFEKCWLYIGHGSEVANKHDFVVRTIGGHNLIFVRSSDGQARAFYNVCPHRGATVCRETSGNAKMFRCLYHSWAFDTQGKTVARPEHQRYGDGSLEPGLSDLAPVPRIDSYRDFFFINYDAGAGSLKDYLAGAASYLDRIADKSEVGMEVIGGTHEYGVSVNWKGVAENGFDGYHITPVHQTYFDYLRKVGTPEVAPPAVPLMPQHSLGNGHAVMEGRWGWGRPVARHAPSWGEAAKKEIDEIIRRLEKRFDKTYASKLVNDDFNMLIFPNFAVNDHMSTNMRILEPDGAHKVRVNSWSIGPKDEPDILREFRIRNFLTFLGPGGLSTPDDCEALEHCQRGYRNLPDGWNDISRGLHETDKITSDEDNQRAFWREWNRHIVG